VLWFLIERYYCISTLKQLFTAISDFMKKHKSCAVKCRIKAEMQSVAHRVAHKLKFEEIAWRAMS
jgi:hypothetical protein